MPLVVQKNGLKMVTNLFIQMPSCLSFKGRYYHFGNYGIRETVDKTIDVADSDDADESSNTVISPVVSVRTFFPETWLWDLFETG